jgi:hypothetical protein
MELNVLTLLLRLASWLSMAAHSQRSSSAVQCRLAAMRLTVWRCLSGLLISCIALFSAFSDRLCCITLLNIIGSCSAFDATQAFTFHSWT